MKKLVAVMALAATLIAASPLAAHAHGARGAVIALGAFAAFTTLVTAPLWAAAAFAPVYYTAPVPYPVPVYASPPAYYAAPPVYYAAPPAYYAPPPAVATPPAIQREVVYPHGRHVLYGDGVTTAHQWVWIPNPPPPAAAPASPASR